MIEISFSTQDTGACPYCSYHEDCHIIDAMRELLEIEVSEKYDEDMEIVIYSCPEFEAERVEEED